MEIDSIVSLLAYAVVHQDWQSSDVPREHRRGYNIGTVLVDVDNRPVSHGLNCVDSTNNVTQHGEVRTIMEYLETSPTAGLNGYSLYATLEPCAMCAGMITMTGVRRTVYGQHDVEFSGAFQRLAFDSRSIGGYPPYPRTVETSANLLPFRTALDSAYREFLAGPSEKVLAIFLASGEAERIFAGARTAFLNYHVEFAENEPVQLACRRYFDALSVPD